MKCHYSWGFLLILLAMKLPALGQAGMSLADLTYLEDRYGGPLPADYKTFILAYQGPSDPVKGIAAQATAPGGINPHYLWTPQKIQSVTDSMRNAGILTKDQLVFGDIGLDQLLIYQRLQGQWSSRVFLWDEQYGWYFHLYSIQYTQPHYLSTDLLNGLDSVGFENQHLSEIEDCLDCQYLYALSLADSDYEDFFMKERQEKALAIYRGLAEQAHPAAAAAIAAHYEFQDEVEADSVILWREKAIRWGQVEDNYELADFILDYRPDLKARAVQALETLLSHRGYAGRGALKLSRLYMRDEGAFKDLEKGIQLARQSAALGNLNAKADLSFYYYKGLGVEQDLQKALDFLVEANEQAKERFGGGMWDEEIEMIKKELK
ncbi:MAG: hypothetical protein KTR30_23575 [Saprospiraceae bacterium]|nr:hypothetical protein [Saprospiraceae bacterium]